MENIDKDKLPYRPSVLGIVFDNYTRFLLTQSIFYGADEWNFPGGAVKDGENPGTALLREFEKELGTNSFFVLYKSKFLLQYEWPDEVIVRHFRESGTMWRGQVKTQYLVKFTGKKKDIKPNLEEVRCAKWVDYEELPRHLIFPKQWENAKKVIKEFLG